MTKQLQSHLDRFSSLRGPVAPLYRWAACHEGGEHAFHVVISCMVHGDEVGGLPAVNDALTRLREGALRFGGKVTFFVGNPEAGLADRRFLDQDLNRMFGRLEGDSHEERRAAELAPLLATAAVHLDLHQTILATKQPFTIFPWHGGCWKWARVLRAASACVTRPANQGFALGGQICADEFVRDQGSPGFTLELGQKGFSDASFERAVTAITHLLAAADRVARGTSTLDDEAAAAPELVFWETAHREPFSSPGHRLRDGLTNFDPVKAGDVLSAPNTPLIVAPMTGCLLFPKYPARDAQGLAQGPLPSEIVRIVTQVDGHPSDVW